MKEWSDGVMECWSIGSRQSPPSLHHSKIPTKGVFWLTLCAALFALGSFAHAQQAGKVYRVGYLSPGPVNEVFLERLRELGYVEGKNIIFEYRLEATGRYPVFAAELVRLKVDCIFAVGIDATRSVKQATDTIPIIMGNFK